MNIYRDGGKVDIETIFEAEKDIGYVFPSKYVEIVSMHDALRLENNVFDFTNIYGDRDERDVNFLSFKKNHLDGDIISNQINISDTENFGHENMVLFGITANGDYVCFDYKEDIKANNPRVVLVYHDDFVDNDDGTSSMAINHVAETFENFINMLHE
ncbi:SMI1/KNR4 family protein [Psychrobacter sp. DAB_AL43B]|uniref:SMI1/KNR4 family protein n=1 Tax=Psychrobacter sp. DAB_AL43B TaxID=1028416 RepID=UPI0009A76D29|nr:SMI1/KNR4 family protein [Psychrobacter sp. DAB_AL43B]SLJ85221.1 hypothetical protein DABAL43B_2032 [Psychrobacter sp. DAB_AL43B]